MGLCFRRMAKHGPNGVAKGQGSAGAGNGWEDEGVPCIRTAVSCWRVGLLTGMAAGVSLSGV